MKADLIIKDSFQNFRHGRIYTNRTPIFHLSLRPALGEGGYVPLLPLARVDALEDGEIDQIGDGAGQNMAEALQNLRADPVPAHCSSIGEVPDDALDVCAGHLFELEVLDFPPLQIFIRVRETVLDRHIEITPESDHFIFEVVV